MVGLIINSMGSDEFKVIPAKEYKIIIPRFLSSIMMHINVESDIRNGINLMKWAINHPNKFKALSNSEDNRELNAKGDMCFG